MKHNGRAPLKASEIRPDLINLREGEPRTMVCPDCRRSRAIRDRMVVAHRAEPHSAQPRHRRTENRVPRCPGSGQRIWIDITPEQWQARYDKLQNRCQDQGVNPGSRHTTRVKRMGRVPVPAITQMRTVTVDQLRADQDRHDASKCTACRVGEPCDAVWSLNDRARRLAVARHRQRKLTL
ncbi:hypothetical protein [Streptomyces sp. DB-54]